MDNLIRLVEPINSLEILGVKLVGVNAENGKKLLFTLIFILLIFLFRKIVTMAANRGFGSIRSKRISFWTLQVVRLATAVFLIIGILSIWFDNPVRLTTALGLVTAGLAFALQKVVTSVAGYFVILRSNNFNVGDRITMGGVRGDVISLGFIQTTIMEMGEPPPVQSGEPAMWVQSRQYTGRVVSVSNDKIFDEPVYNYTRDFPYIWEEIAVPVRYDADRRRAEAILLDAATKHTVKISELSEDTLQEMTRRYFLKASDVKPRVFYRLTDNWLEMTVRFVTMDHGIRAVKDAISRDVLSAFDAAGIVIASATFDIVGLPKVKLHVDRPPV